MLSLNSLEEAKEIQNVEVPNSDYEESQSVSGDSGEQTVRSNLSKYKIFNQNDEFKRKAKRSVLYYKNTDLLDHYLYDSAQKKKGGKKRLQLDLIEQEHMN